MEESDEVKKAWARVRKAKKMNDIAQVVFLIGFAAILIAFAIGVLLK